MGPLVSIVINNYNYADYLRRAIESALDQTYSDFEVIVVDDGSTDASRSIISEYAARTRVIFKDNGGQASAFNAGIEAARGDFTLLLDSDDFLYPEALRSSIDAFPPGYSRVYFRLQLVDEHDQPIDRDIGFEVFRPFDGDAEKMLGSPAGHWAAPTSGNIYRTGVLRQILPVPEKEFRVCADLYVNLRSLFLGPIKSVDETLGAYRIHGANRFSSRNRLLSDEKVLKTRLEHDYRFHTLLEDCMQQAGLERPTDPGIQGFDFLQKLVAGKTLGIDSAPVIETTHQELAARILRYARQGENGASKRFLRSMFLFIVLLTPKPLGRGLLGIKDKWALRTT
jgi:hypothetical protein